jgi:hypothetical protein
MRHYISYESICETKARDFLEENVGDLAEGIAEDRDFDDISAVERLWHEQVTDIAFNDSDAHFVIDNSSNTETDGGLWEGMEPDEAIRIQAAYTFSNDVKTEATAIYDRVKDEVSDAMGDFEFEGGENERDGDHGATRVVFLDTETDEKAIVVVDAEDEDVGLRVMDASGAKATATLVDGKLALDGSGDFSDQLLFVAKTLLDEGLDSGDLEEKVRGYLAAESLKSELAKSEPTPIEPGTEEERVAIRDWLRMGREIGMRSGYPLGQSYIDARSGTLWGTKDHAYVESDRELRLQLPHLAGKYRDAIEAYYEETFGGPQPTNADEALAKVVALINDRADNHELRRFADSVRHLLEPSAAPAP